MVILPTSNCEISSSKVLPFCFSAKQPSRGLTAIHSPENQRRCLSLPASGTGLGGSTPKEGVTQERCFSLC